MNNRRDFLKKAVAGTALLGLSNSRLYAFAKENLLRLTILHTNDVHSRIEPYPDNHARFAGQGGFARRAALVKSIRAETQNVLLLDAGDIFQGTPYYNMFDGKLELKLMNEMGYDAATIGNHEFDSGLDGLKFKLSYAGFPMLSCNYDFSDTALKGMVEPYHIIVKDGLKIGIIGVGIELRGLVSSRMFGQTRYLDPVEKVNETAAVLKNDEGCDFVICLSHLGLEYDSAKVSDVVLAKNSRNVNLIIGGHTHRLLEQPYRRKNLENKEVVVTQAGHNGLHLGKLDYLFERKSRKILASYYTTKKIKNQG